MVKEKKPEKETCPICHEIKSIKNFMYGHPEIIKSIVCMTCAVKMDSRLEAFVEFDKEVCRRLGLDYWNVSNYEKALREDGLYRDSRSFKTG